MTDIRQRAELPKGAVPAVERATRLLDTLAESKEPLSQTALTAKLGLPKSTVHGLCATLVHSGLITRFDNGTYHLGMHIMDLAHAFLARSDLTSDFLQILESTRPLVQESIVLSVLDGADVIYVACRNGTRAFGFDFRIGMRLPANCAASGKVLLSTRPTDTVLGLTQAGTFYGLTSKSVTDPDQLMQQLAQIRRRGYGIDDEETRLGMVCVSAPVFKVSTGEAVAAVGVSMPKASMNADQKSAAIDAVKQVAKELSKRLGAA